MTKAQFAAHMMAEHNAVHFSVSATRATLSAMHQREHATRRLTHTHDPQTGHVITTAGRLSPGDTP
jgi:hypothetical protein